MILSFDESKLNATLEGYPPKLRAVFAATCAERLMPAYAKFAEVSNRGAPGALQDALRALWQDLLGEKSLQTDEIAALVAAVTEQIPDEDEEPWVDEQAVAQDAASAVAYALRCRQSGESNEAAWAGRCVYEALDGFVIQRWNIDTSQGGSNDQVMVHPLVQAELGRQQRDLRALAAEHDPCSDVIRMLRDQSQVESRSMFGDSP